jgi:hypothetical protein
LRAYLLQMRYIFSENPGARSPRKARREVAFALRLQKKKFGESDAETGAQIKSLSLSICHMKYGVWRMKYGMK